MIFVVCGVWVRNRARPQSPILFLVFLDRFVSLLLILLLLLRAKYARRADHMCVCVGAKTEYIFSLHRQ